MSDTPSGAPAPRKFTRNLDRSIRRQAKKSSRSMEASTTSSAGNRSLHFPIKLENESDGERERDSMAQSSTHKSLSKLGEKKNSAKGMEASASTSTGNRSLYFSTNLGHETADSDFESVALRSKYEDALEAQCSRLAELTVQTPDPDELDREYAARYGLVMPESLKPSGARTPPSSASAPPKGPYSEDDEDWDEDWEILHENPATFGATNDWVNINQHDTTRFYPGFSTQDLETGEVLDTEQFLVSSKNGGTAFDDADEPEPGYLGKAMKGLGKGVKSVSMNVGYGLLNTTINVGYGVAGIGKGVVSVGSGIANVGTGIASLPGAAGRFVGIGGGEGTVPRPVPLNPTAHRRNSGFNHLHMSEGERRRVMEIMERGEELERQKEFGFGSRRHATSRVSRDSGDTPYTSAASSVAGSPTYAKPTPHPEGYFGPRITAAEELAHLELKSRSQDDINHYYHTVSKAKFKDQMVRDYELLKSQRGKEEDAGMREEAFLKERGFLLRGENREVWKDYRENGKGKAKEEENYGA